MTGSGSARERDTSDRRSEGLESPVEGFNARARAAVADLSLIHI